MRDVDVRRALRRQLLREYAHDPGTLIVEELGLDVGRARIDIAVVNGHLAGYELKSASDTLGRLEQQAAAYGRVLDYVTIVAAERHVEGVLDLVPEWWGLTVAVEQARAITLIPQRVALTNPSIDPFALASLLWRDEAMAVLEERRAAAGVRSKPRRDVWARLATALPLDELRGEVRARLRSRRAWRPGLPPA